MTSIEMSYLTMKIDKNMDPIMRDTLTALKKCVQEKWLKENPWFDMPEQNRTRRCTQEEFDRHTLEMLEAEHEMMNDPEVLDMKSKMSHKMFV